MAFVQNVKGAPQTMVVFHGSYNCGVCTEQGPNLHSPTSISPVSLTDLQTSKARAEARLEVLCGAGVNVDEWLADNEDEEVDDGLTDGRLSPAVSAHTDSSDKVRMSSDMCLFWIDMYRECQHVGKAGYCIVMSFPGQPHTTWSQGA